MFPLKFSCSETPITFCSSFPSLHLFPPHPFWGQPFFHFSFQRFFPVGYFAQKRGQKRFIIFKVSEWRPCPRGENWQAWSPLSQRENYFTSTYSILAMSGQLLTFVLLWGSQEPFGGFWIVLWPLKAGAGGFCQHLGVVPFCLGLVGLWE